jgi:hypothetical protein
MTLFDPPLTTGLPPEVNTVIFVMILANCLTDVHVRPWTRILVRLRRRRAWLRRYTYRSQLCKSPQSVHISYSLCTGLRRLTNKRSRTPPTTATEGSSCQQPFEHISVIGRPKKNRHRRMRYYREQRAKWHKRHTRETFDHKMQMLFRVPLFGKQFSSDITGDGPPTQLLNVSPPSNGPVLVLSALAMTLLSKLDSTMEQIHSLQLATSQNPTPLVHYQLRSLRLSLMLPLLRNGPPQSL